MAFEDVSFEVGYGEVFGFLGPNGAGKTTTVRTLGTLLAPTSGSATVAGIQLSAENGPAIRSRISIMPESPGLYLRLTVAENLRVLRRALRAGRHPRAYRAGAAGSQPADRAGDPCGSLSKGLRQRVALARALLNDPAVLFLDEPTSGLDPVATHEVHELVASLRERGVTIFLTTHRLEEAERLCHRVAILNTTLRLIGRPDELRDQLFSRSLEVRVRTPLGRSRPRCSAVCRGSRDGSRRRPLSADDRQIPTLPPRRGPSAGGRRRRHLLACRVSPLVRGRLPRAHRRGRGGEAAMTFSWTRVGAILQKELRDYRRNRFMIVHHDGPAAALHRPADDPAVHRQRLDIQRQARHAASDSRSSTCCSSQPSCPPS